MQRTYLATVAFALVLSACGRTPLEGRSDTSVDPDSSIDGGVDGGVCMTDLDCDDGLSCTGVEMCSDGRCVPGDPIRCDDGIACTNDRCTEMGGCESIPDSDRCAMGEICSPVEGCIREVCGSDAECDDGFICNGAEVCSDGFCAPGRPPVCDDRVDCTVDECSEARGGCVNLPNDFFCDDRAFCNGAETCTPRGCQPGEPIFCPPGPMAAASRCAAK